MKKNPIIVIKLGTSSIVDETTHQPLLSTLAVIVETAVNLRRDGYKVIIVSSGAIGVALQRMGLPRRPKHLPQVQALAAIGQSRLMGLWEQLFDRLGQTIAQILLTRTDIADRTQYLNAQNTFSELLNMGVIPIVNENDTLSVSEIKFGDNDTLSAITAGMVQADYLFLMTDVDCLYDRNPRKHPLARRIELVEDIAELDADVTERGSALGTGGMSTKIVAARLATAAGVTTIITRSSRPGNVASIVRYLEAQKVDTPTAQTPNKTATPTAPTPSLTPTTTTTTPALNLTPATPTISRISSSTTLNGLVTPSPTPDPLPPPPLHTRFLPSPSPIRDRHFWILHGLAPHGTLYIDRGAAHALATKAGLLPVGVVDVDGAFAQQECVRLVEVDRRPASTAAAAAGTSTPPRDALASAVAPDGTATPPSHAGGRDIGRALVNYSAAEIRRIRGLRSAEIAAVLGYADSEYVALRENVALAAVAARGDRSSRPGTPTAGTAASPGRALLGGGLAGYV